MSHNGRHGRVILPFDSRANDEQPATKAEVRALVIELVGAIAHAQVELERKLAALESHLGLTYHPPEDSTVATLDGPVSENAGGDSAARDSNATPNGGDVE